MHPELTQFENWLACQYPHSSVRKHYMSDLALFLCGQTALCHQIS